MEKIYSKIHPDKLLHVIHRLEDVINRKKQRLDLIDKSQFIQCSSLKMKRGTTFQAHQHVWKTGKQSVIAQESWNIVIGSVKGFFYDLNGDLLQTTNLYVGDVSFTLEGGHNYEILEDNTIVYEYKTGPYEGQTLDKVFI
tara:strand:+ start:1809 stop:2228 length:420 start_codon:yes stop_codon:yes gene_type:complete